MDIFGAGVNFFYKGQEYFNTRWGCAVTCFVTLTYLFVVSLKWVEFFGETDPIEYFSEAQQSMLDPIDLNELGFSFAIDSLEERFGTIQVTQVNWSVENGVKYENEITLEKCDAISSVQLTNQFTMARNPERMDYLCPDSQSKMLVQGGFSEEEFRYIKISLKPCDPLKTSCASASELAQKKPLRLHHLESSINYETHDTHQAIKLVLSSNHFLMLDPAYRRKQDVFLSKSEIYFESKWSAVEILSDGVPFIEVTDGSPLTVPRTTLEDQSS